MNFVCKLNIFENKNQLITNLKWIYFIIWVTFKVKQLIKILSGNLSYSNWSKLERDV